jgi:RNA polymerase sigma factor (TIGR02999 family)
MLHAGQSLLKNGSKMHGDADITRLLLAWRTGDANALDRLFPLIYDELRRVAHRQLGREHPGHTLDSTALVHEAYFRLVDQTRIAWADRSHFLAIAAQVMHRVLVDYARQYRAMRRGGSPERVALDDNMLVVEERADTLLALDEAMSQLAQLDERLSRVVECRFFGGLTEEETAQALGVTGAAPLPSEAGCCRRRSSSRRAREPRTRLRRCSPSAVVGSSRRCLSGRSPRH